MGCRPERAGVGGRTWALALLGALAAGAAAHAAEVETRDFQVFVDGKAVGNAQMTIKSQEDGVTVMTCDTDVRVKVLVRSYTYSYRGQEKWKDGRLLQFDSACNDDGKLYSVAGVAEGQQLRLKVNNQEKMVRGDVWLSSYWHQPDRARVNQTVPVLDADTGTESEVRVSYVGPEQRPVVGQPMALQHYRLQGKTITDLWYDAAGRLVHQEWMEEGHRTALELLRLRR